MDHVIVTGFITGGKAYRVGEIHPFEDDEKRAELLREGFIARAPEIDPEHDIIVHHAIGSDKPTFFRGKRKPA